MSSTLLGGSDSSSSSSEDDGPTPGTSGTSGTSGFKVNQSYANHYNQFREKEHFQKLKDRYGTADGDEDSSSSEEEDEDGRELTEGMEKEFFATLAALKTKNPAIYDGKTNFFSEKKEKKEEGEGKSSSKSKPLTLGDMERKVMLEKGGHYDELEDEELAKKSEGKTFVQEMEDLRESFKTAVNEDDDDDNEDASTLFSKKSKSKELKKKEEAEYKEWLAGQKKELEDKEEEEKMKGLRDFWTNKNLPKDEKFLRDYILKKGYLQGDDFDMEDDDDDNDGGHDKLRDDDDDLSEDEKTVKRMDEFEEKFNFRYEEPDPEFIKRYPRTIKDSMRREDTSRKQKRDAVKERKEREKERQREELKQLKALKKKEIVEKISKLKKIAGTDGLDFAEEDIDADFDPEEHDRRMAAVFDQYDNVAVENEDEKPVFSDLDSDIEEELEVDNWDGWTGNNKNGNDDEDEEGEDDGERAQNEGEDYEEYSRRLIKKQAEKELVESTKTGKKRRQSKFAEALLQKKPLFNPGDKSFDKYFDEYYKLDYEDLIGDTKCRFKYRNVPKNDFGLTVNEILSAPDRELNSWCSLKKTCAYRTEEEEQEDVRVFKGRGNNVHLKKKYLPSIFKENPEEELQAEKDSKSRKKGKKRKADDEDGEGQQEEEAGDNDNDEPQPSTSKAVAESKPMSKSAKKRLKKKARAAKAIAEKQHEAPATAAQSPPSKKAKKSKDAGKSDKKNAINADIKMSDERLAAYGLNPSQFKRKEKKKKFKE